MAKTGVSEKDPTEDLKKEFQRLVKAIMEESSSDDQSEFAENVERALQTLQTLRDLKKEGKQKQRSSSSIEIDDRILHLCPQEFICPLSKDIMRDPVIVSTGTTYDRPSIQKWLKEGNRTCPITQKLISNPNLTPNHLVREMISQWCKNRGVRYPNPDRFLNKDGLTEADYELLVSLFKMLASTLAQQKEAARALRSLTKRLPPFRAYFTESIERIPHLLTPLTQPEIEIDPILHQDLITTLMNLSVHEPNKQIIAETPMLIPVVMEALRSGTMETRSNAAATLFTLSALDSNKTLIGKSGALKPLIDLLEEGHSFVMKDVVSAISNLCNDNENKNHAVESGAVRVVLKKIEERVHLDELVVILVKLSSNYKAVVEMADLGGVSVLFSLIKETNCERNKENCVAVLSRICLIVESKWKEMREEEFRFGTLSKIVETGSLRAKRKANAILDRIKIRRTYSGLANSSFKM